MTYDPRTYWPARHAKHGDTYVAKLNSPGAFRRELATFGDAVRSLSRVQGKRVLDFGCGVGRWTPILADGAATYLGVDITPSAIDVARNSNSGLLNVSYEVLAYDRLPSYQPDLIVALWVVQHIPDFTPWAAEFQRVLAPGGAVVLIEHGKLENPAKHMFPRTTEEIAALLGMSVVNLIYFPEHWAARFELNPEPDWDRE